MNNLTKFVAIAVTAAVVFVAVFFTFRVTFEFKSWEVGTDNGVFLSISYSSSQSLTATLTDPDNQVVDQTVFPAGDSSGQFSMSQGESSPAAGIYIIKIEQSGRIIYENYFEFVGPALNIENIQVLQWGAREGLATIENVSLFLANGGDLPVYVYRVAVAGQSTWVERVDNWILPGRKNFSWNLSDVGLQPGVHSWQINAESRSENIARSYWMLGVPTVEEAQAVENSADAWSGTVTTAPGWHVIDSRHSV